MAWDRGAGTAPVYRTKRHRQARAAMLRAYQPGDPCCLCGHPMYPPTSNLHADHCPDCRGDGCAACAGTGYRGLAHGTEACEACGVRCNVVDGARRGNERSRRSEARSWTL